MPKTSIPAAAQPPAKRGAPRPRQSLRPWAGGALALAGAQWWCAALMGDALAALLFVLVVTVLVLGLIAPWLGGRKG